MVFWWLGDLATAASYCNDASEGGMALVEELFRPRYFLPSRFKPSYLPNEQCEL